MDTFKQGATAILTDTGQTIAMEIVAVPSLRLEIAQVSNTFAKQEDFQLRNVTCWRRG